MALNGQLNPKSAQDKKKKTKKLNPKYKVSTISELGATQQQL